MNKIILPDTYTYNTACGNCSKTSLLRIPLGITVRAYTQEHKCTVCGCKMFGEGEQFSPQADRPAPMIYIPFSLLGRQ